MAEIVPLNNPSDRPLLIHGTCLLLGQRALLLRGASGSGKSRLAGAIMHDAKCAGRFARLVADDQVEARAVNDRLLLGTPSRIAGLREHVGIGVLPELYECRAIAGLVVDLTGNNHEAQRMPDQTALVTRIESVSLPRLFLDAGAPGTVSIILEAMARLAQNRYRPETLSTIRIESLLHPTPQIFNDRSRI